MRKVGAPTDGVYIEVRSGSRTGTLLATSDTTGVQYFSTAYGLIEFSFPTPPALTSGTLYYFNAFRSGSVDAANYYQVGVDDSGSYSGGGAAYTNSSLVWNPEVASNDWSFKTYSTIVLDKVSGTDSGFANTVTGGDTDPFNSGEKASFTVQVGDALADGTYYWRARAKDPSGTNTYGAWATARTFTIDTSGGPPPNTTNFFSFF